MFRYTKIDVGKIKECGYFILILLNIFLRIYGFWSKDYSAHETLGLPLSSDNIINPISFSFIKDIIYRSIIFTTIQIFTESPWIVRIPNIIASIMTVFVLYKIFGEKKGLFFMLCFSFMSMYQGQMAHPSSFSFLFYLLSWKSFNERKIKPAIIYAIVAIFSYWAFLPYVFSLFLTYSFKYRDKRTISSLSIFPLLVGLFILGNIIIHNRLSEEYNINYKDIGGTDILYPGPIGHPKIIDIVRFISGNHSNEIFIISLILLIIGIIPSIRKDLPYILSLAVSTILIYIWSITYMKYLHPRYFLPITILYNQIVYQGISLIPQRFLQISLILILSISNLTIYTRYLNSPVSFDYPFLMENSKINKYGNIIYVLPTYGKTEWDLHVSKSAIMSLISCRLKNCKINFLVENKDYHEVIATGEGFRRDKHKIISIREINFPKEIYIVITPIFYPQVGGMLKWWEINVEDIVKLNRKIEDKLKSYGINQIDSSIGFIGFRYNFKDEEELKKIVNRLYRIVTPLKKDQIIFK